jgi:CRISPR-associated protein Csx10
MNALRYRLRLLSPTCVALRPEGVGQIAGTHSYLPGSAVRGALAGLWLRGGRRVDLTSERRAAFDHIFLNPEVRFGCAWPYAHNRDTQVVPLSAWSQKRDGGWRGDRKKGVKDVLADLLRAEHTQQPPTDLDDLDRYSGEFVSYDVDWRDLTPRRRLITRTAITPPDPDGPPSREVVADGRLFSIEALEAGQEFSGVVSGPDGPIADLTAVLDAAAAPEPGAMVPVTLGQARSRGLGHAVLVEVDSPWAPEEPRDPDALLAQARRFTERAGGNPATTYYLPITLESDALLRDRFRIPCTSGEPGETLWRVDPPPPATMILALAVQTTRWVGGWDILLGAPREAQLAVQQGSIWVYSVPTNDVPAAIAWWLTAERRGIGERTTEGFGQVQLLHPLHLEEKAV